MSYILEALKKAQAERQLGNAPTINAVPVAPPPAPAGTRGLPLIAGGAAGAALIVVGALWWWMRVPAPAPATVVTVAPAPAAVAVPPAAVVVPPAPAVSAAPPLAVAPPTKPAAVEATPQTKAVPASAPVPVPVPVSVPAPAIATSVKPASDDSDRLPALRDLPDNVRASIPQVRFGGYMYSNNPADRLLLIDTVLRHEGEEVAPGLVLEKLLPKAALMNYRGTRYKVPY